MNDQRTNRTGGRRVNRHIYFAIVSLLVFGCSGPPTDEEFNSLKTNATPIVEQLEAYKRVHKEYPSDVAKVGIELPDAAYGGWKYRTRENNSVFALSLGDYGRNGFVLFWDSKHGVWYLDN